jgi:hypothetical protein
VVLSLLLLNASWLAVTALAIAVAVPFTIEALRYAGLAIRQMAARKAFLHTAGAAGWNLVVALAVLFVGRHAGKWVIGVAAGLRLATTSLNLPRPRSTRTGRKEVIADIGIERPERLAETGAWLRKPKTTGSPPIAAGSRHLLGWRSREPYGLMALGILSPVVAVLAMSCFALPTS